MSQFRQHPSLFRALAVTLTLIFLAGCATDEFDPDDSNGVGGGAGSPSGSGGGWGAAGGGAGTSGGSSTGGQGKKPSGVGCIQASECISNFCEDGVCCASECGGPCESCSQPGSAGSCQPYAAGEDPESECLGALKSDGPCAGRCDGAGACKMPGAETSCGQKSCVDAKQTASVCDGKGGCIVAQNSCAPFTCGGAACATSCLSDLQCADAGTYCKNGDCVLKMAPSAPCTANNQCATNSCVDGVCCTSSSCAAPSSCATGICTCGGMICAPGVSCVPWFEDSDGDGFGDKAKSIFACSSDAAKLLTGGKAYVSNAGDCFDSNKNAFPGQTAFFGTPRGDGSFDYDCNGSDEKKYATVPSPLCRDCHGYGPTACGLQCGSLGLKSMGLTCNLPNSCGGPKDTQAFAFEVGCGGLGDLRSCVACSTGMVVPDNLGTVQQVCR